MQTNTTPLMDSRFACLVMGDRASDYESLEIEPVRHVGGPVPDQGDVRIDHTQPEFFSVYLRHKDGLAACVGDHGSHGLATAYASELAKAHGWDIHDHVTGETIQAEAIDEPVEA